MAIWPYGRISIWPFYNYDLLSIAINIIISSLLINYHYIITIVHYYIITIGHYYIITDHHYPPLITIEITSNNSIETMYAIYGNIYHPYTPVMLVYIAAYMDPMGTNSHVHN